ncbi:MAG TPA: hypothetical protein VF939_06220 [Puia sp.]
MDSLEYIDGYFNGEFSPEETRQFEKRIQDDPMFAEKVAFHVSAYIAFKEEHAVERKRRFREMYRQTISQAKARRAEVRRFLSAIAAAALFAGIALCWYLFFNPVAAPRLADQYIRQNLDLLSVKMGTVDSMQTGLTLYNEGKFPEALQQFETILRADSSNSTAMLNAGITSLRMQDFDKALDFFKKLEVRTDPHLNPALFYGALTLMKRNHAGDPTLAKQFLRKIVQKDLNKKEEALELLREL